jgi:hypothetical protein
MEASAVIDSLCKEGRTRKIGRDGGYLRYIDSLCIEEGRTRKIRRDGGIWRF